ncbi:MAG: dephospho-CoA kinase [Hyphomicrobium sp.]
MLIVGLTGSIGMGKSTALSYLRAKGVPVFDADAEVHKIYVGETAQEIEKAFPGSTTVKGVDRHILSEKLAQDTDGFKRLEGIVYPLLEKRKLSFLKECQQKGEKIVILDIPLLYETNMDKKVDVVLLVSASAAIQRERVLSRPQMTEHKFEQLLSRQLPDSEKRKRAHFVVDTNGPLESTQRQLNAILEMISERRGQAYARYWN